MLLLFPPEQVLHAKHIINGSVFQLIFYFLFSSSGFQTQPVPYVKIQICKKRIICFFMNIFPVSSCATYNCVKNINGGSSLTQKVYEEECYQIAKSQYNLSINYILI